MESRTERPKYLRRNQTIKSAPPRYGKTRPSRSHSGARANSFICACWAAIADRCCQNHPSGNVSGFCSGISTGICATVACPSSTACAAVRRRNDRRTAAQAVLEGQATVAQIPVLMPEQKPDTFPLGWFWKQRAAMAAQQAQMKEFARAPLWLREGLIFPYLGGADFMVWFRRRY